MVLSASPRPAKSNVSSLLPPLCTTIARHDIGVTVTGTVQIATAGQGDVLLLNAERIADTRLDHITASIGQRLIYLAGTVNDVGIVPGAADGMSLPLPPLSVSTLTGSLQQRCRQSRSIATPRAASLLSLGARPTRTPPVADRI